MKKISFFITVLFLVSQPLQAHDIIATGKKTLTTGSCAATTLGAVLFYGLMLNTNGIEATLKEPLSYIFAIIGIGTGLQAYDNCTQWREERKNANHNA